jgi:hypothetical protein
MRDKKKQVRSGRFFTGIFLLLNLLAGIFGVSAGATEYGDVTVTMNALAGGESTHGYAEYIVTITNKSSRRRVVSLALPAREYSRGNGIDSLTRTVAVEPGVVAKVSMWQPALSINGALALGVTIDGIEMQENVPGVSINHGNGYWRDRPLLLMSQGASKAGLQGEFTTVLSNLVKARSTPPVKTLPVKPATTAKPATKPSGKPGTGVGPGAAPPPPAAPVPQQYSPGAEMEGGGTVPGPAVAAPAVPATAIAEPSEDGEVAEPLSPDAKPVSPELFKLISSYSKLEVSFAQAEIPVSEWSDSWCSYSRYDCVALTADEFNSLAGPIRNALRDWVGAGGSLLILGNVQFSPDWETSKATGTPIATEYSQFGEVLTTGGKDLKDLTGDEWVGVWLALHRTLQPWQRSMSPSDANREFPVVQNFAIPLRGLFVLILLFVIIIGPVNFWLLNRFKKRMFMLVTIPACAFVASVGVSGFALLSEGISGKTRVASFTVLNEPLRRATTFGVEAFYTPLTPGGGLRFDAGTEITPILQPYGSDGVSRSIDWTSDQHLKQGWIVSRVPAHFLLRKVESRRERLTIINEPDGRVTVVNGLGAAIRDLTLIDAKGGRHSAQNIPAGARVTLTASTMKTAASLTGLRNFYGGNWTLALDNIDNAEGTAVQCLGPNRYVAVLDGAPFIENDALKGGLKRAESVVLGIAGGEGQ